MEINWSLLGAPPNIGASFMQGEAQGRQRAIQARTDNALADIQKDPTNTSALGTLAIYNPQAAQSVMQMREYQRQDTRRNALSASLDPVTHLPDYNAAATRLAPTDPEGAMTYAAASRKQATDRIEFAKKVTNQVIEDAGNVHDQASYVGWLQRAAPQWKAAGLAVPDWLPPTYSEDGMHQIRLHALDVAGQLKEMQPDQKQFGRYVFEDGKPKYLLPPDAPYMPVQQGGHMERNPAAVLADGRRVGIVDIGTDGAEAPTAPASASPAAPPNGATYPPERAAMLRAIWGQESNNTPGVTGPATPYGHALGIGQTLPATAKAMAQKIGLQWHPELLKGTSDEAAQYQRALSAAYLDEAAAAAGGYNENAAKYYFAGPNHALWGEKTHRYGREVMARIGADPKYAVAPEATAVIDGKAYHKIDGKWFHTEQQQAAAATVNDGGDE